mgnify:CR=1 FL=1
MRMFGAVALIGCFLWGGGSSTRVTPESRVFLGVSQGPVIPLAFCDSGRWTNQWPKAGESMEKGDPSREEMQQLLFDELGEDGQLPATWWFLPFQGQQREIRASGVTWIDTHCRRSWGISTEVPQTEPRCKKCCPDPKLGIVSNLPLFDRPFETMRGATQ